MTRRVADEALRIVRNLTIDRMAAISLALSVLSFPFVYLSYFAFVAVQGSEARQFYPFAVSPVGWLVELAAVGMAGTAVALAAGARLASLRHPRPLRGWSMVADGLVVASVMLCCNLVLLRDLHLARARNVADMEVAAAGVLRDLVSAERDHATRNGGYFDTLECLVQPCRCIPRCDLPPGDWAPPRRPTSALFPYHETLYPGPRPAELDPRRHSPSSVTGYAIVAVPAPMRWDLRALCIEPTSDPCVLPRRDVAAAAGGHCPASCRPWDPRRRTP